MEDKKVSEIYTGALDSDGVYPVDVNVGNFDSILITFSDKFDDIKDVGSIMVNTRSLIPHLKSHTDQNYIVSDSSGSTGDSTSTVAPYRAFDGSAQYNSPPTGWISGSQALPAWLQIQKTDGKIRANMFTIYQGRSDYRTQYTTSIHCQIQGSNDGVNWDILVDDPTPVVVYTKSTTYYLEDYVEYSYYRAVMLDGYEYWNGHKYWAITEFLIQDSAIHGYGQHTPVEVVKSGSGDNAAFDTISPYGTVRLTNDTLELQNLTRTITSVYGLSSRLDTYRLYRKGTDGTPTLFMPDQTTIGSSLGTVDLSTDLASLASKEYVADEVDKFSRSSLAGKVNSTEDLPAVVPNEMEYTAPSLFLQKNNGIPYTDEYAVECNSVHSAPYEAWCATFNVDDHGVPSGLHWHSAPEHTVAFPWYYTMYFKTPTRVTSLRMVNDDRGLVMTEYSVEALGSDDVWMEVIPVRTNTHTNPNEEWTIDLSDNDKHFKAYRLKITGGTSAYGATYVLMFLIEPSGYAAVGQTEFDDIRPGTIYLVGTESDLEEYILTEWGTWERLGEIRQSDVDLSGYTTTSDMMPFIGASSATLDSNIDTMRDEVSTYLDELRTSIEGAIVELPIETQFLETMVPSTWPTHIEHDGFLFVMEPEYEVQPYTAPHITTNGIPYEDEYAVSTDGEYTGMFAHEASYSSPHHDRVWCSKNTVMPQYFNMVFKRQLRATSMQLVNRYSSPGYPVHPIHEFTLEARVDSTSTWEPVYSDSHTETRSNVSVTYEFENDKFYHEYRLVIHSAHADWAIINLLQLAGDVKKV